MSDPIHSVPVNERLKRKDEDSRDERGRNFGRSEGGGGTSPPEQTNSRARPSAHLRRDDSGTDLDTYPARSTSLRARPFPWHRPNRYRTLSPSVRRRPRRRRRPGRFRSRSGRRWKGGGVRRGRRRGLGRPMISGGGRAGSRLQMPSPRGRPGPRTTRPCSWWRVTRDV